MGTLKGLVIEISNTALRVTSLMLEGRELVGSMRYTGDRWRAQFEEFQLDADQDLDIYMEVGGPPHASCRITVTIGKKEPILLDPQRFDAGGNLVVIKTINP